MSQVAWACFLVEFRNASVRLRSFPSFRFGDPCSVSGSTTVDDPQAIASPKLKRQTLGQD